ncbi:MAG TPA: CHAD domain-containing protein [Ignavibacteriaceae bacterium]|nr:CHAD domain-containing protein [Ignavibacteriaceae bacterium]
MAKSWKINGLHNNELFCDSAKIIMYQKLKQLLSAISSFFENENPEKLHQVRIALRRVRYNMELFISCFDKKKFLILYKQLEFLQDFSGRIRDMDVLLQNMKSLKEENIRLPKLTFKKIGDERENLIENLKLELMKFIHSKALSNFQKLLS